MNVLKELNKEVNEANQILRERKRINDIAVEYERDYVRANCEEKADWIISRIPKLVKEYLLTTNQYQRKYYYGIRICNLDITNDLKNYECGHADPRPGSFAEYLSERLIGLGFKPNCRWDVREIFPLPAFWIFKKWKSPAYMTIDPNHLPKPE